MRLTAAFFLPFGVDLLEILIVFLFVTEKVRQLRLVPELTRLLGYQTVSITICYHDDDALLDGILEELRKVALY